MRKTDPLGRFYTGAMAAHAFAGMFDDGPPGSVLDLGAGDGSLANALCSRWPGTAIQTVDIDPKAGGAARACLEDACCEHRHLVCDVLDWNLPEKLEGRPFDLCISNPPYANVLWRNGFSRILEEAGLARLAVAPGSAISAETLFLAQLLRLSRPGSEVGLIISDGMVASRRHLPFRQAILDRLRVKRVVQLPKGSFAGTEAQAYALVCLSEPLRRERRRLMNPETAIVSKSAFWMRQAGVRRRSGWTRKPRRRASTMASIVRRSAVSSRASSPFAKSGRTYAVAH